MRLLPKKSGRKISGKCPGFWDADVLAFSTMKNCRHFAGQTVSMIFQEPALALDPVYTIGRQIAGKRNASRRQRARPRRWAQARWEMLGGGAPFPSAKPPARCVIRTKCPAACASGAMIALGARLQAENPSRRRADPPAARCHRANPDPVYCCRELQREFGNVRDLRHPRYRGGLIEICDRVAVMYAGPRSSSRAR